MPFANQKLDTSNDKGLTTLEHRKSPLGKDLVDFYNESAGAINIEALRSDSQKRAFSGYNQGAEISKLRKKIPYLFEAAFGGRRKWSERKNLSRSENEFWRKRLRGIIEAAKKNHSGQLKARQGLGDTIFKDRKEQMDDALVTRERTKTLERLAQKELVQAKRDATQLAIKVLGPTLDDPEKYERLRPSVVDRYKGTLTEGFIENMIPKTPNAHLKELYAAYSGPKDGERASEKREVQPSDIGKPGFEGHEVGEDYSGTFVNGKLEPGTVVFKDDPEGKTASQKRIDNLMVTQGVTEQVASSIVEGTTRLVVNPVTGERTMVDLLTGTEEPVLNLNKTTEIVEQTEKPRTLWQIADSATGPLSAAKAGLSVASGMVGGPISEETMQNRQYLKSAEDDLVRALSNNQRYPVAEMNRIIDRVKLRPQVFDSGPLLKQRLIANDEYLTNRSSNERRASRDQSLPVNVRKDALKAANAIDNFLELMGVPSGEEPLPVVTSQEESDALSPGDHFIWNGKEMIKGE